MPKRNAIQPKTKKKVNKLVKSSRKKIKTKKKVVTKKSATKKRSKKSRKNNKLKSINKTRGVKKLRSYLIGQDIQLGGQQNFATSRVTMRKIKEIQISEMKWLATGITGFITE